MLIEWTNIGNISVVQAALGVTARDAASIEALAAGKTAVYTPTDGAKEAELRFITPADSDDWVVEQYAAKGAYDHYTRMATLTLEGGTQVHSTGKVFCDTITATNEVWYGNLPVPEEVQGTTDDFISRYHWKLMGYTRFLFIASTIVAGKILEIEVAEIT